MKTLSIYFLTNVFLLLTGTLTAQETLEKNRVLVLTDIENEPDDAQSLVRFLTYANQWDVAGLVATTSRHQPDKTAAWRILEILDAYDDVRDNLEQHEKGYPEAAYLRSLVKEGKASYGMEAVGPGMDSPGSDWIIQTVDQPDPRPLWVLVWGGSNCLAQALWKVRQTRSSDALHRFVAKLRVYAISDQDDSGPWLRKNFPALFYIVSPGVHSLGAYHFGTWSGISGDKFHGRFAGGDFEIVDNPWLDEHIRSKGPLGAEYPFTEYLMEGDSPSFLYLIPNGLGNPEHPDWGSWGGRYEYYRPRTEAWFSEPETRPLWTDAMDEVLGADGAWHTSNKATIFRWRKAFQNDFSARMDWTIKSYSEANHPPVPRLGMEERLQAKVGDRIDLNATESFDPDGDNLQFHWFLYGEPGEFTLSNGRTATPLTIVNADQANAHFVVPQPGRTGALHLILEVRDEGIPALTRYKRIIVDVLPR